MVDGGLFSWKVWKVQKSHSRLSHGNDYNIIRKPLPEPKNLKWIRDEKTHEWFLVPKDQSQEKIVPSATFSSLSDTSNNINKNEVGHVFEHIVLPTDTFSGLCLQYKTTATKLRQFNIFSGTNLKLAPAKLLIPVTRKNRHRVRAQDRSSHEFLIHLLLAEVPELRCRRTALAYLSLTEWESRKAIEQASEDLRWEDENKLRLIEMGQHSKEESKRNHSSRDTKPNKCKEAMVPCMIALQNFLNNVLNNVDESKSGKEEWFEMKEFASRRPSLDSLSETSTTSEEVIDTIEYGNTSLEEGQYMVQCSIGADSNISVNQVVKNLTEFLPSNFDMLKTKVTHMFQDDSSNYMQAGCAVKSFEMQCLIGKKVKEKIH